MYQPCFGLYLLDLVAHPIWTVASEVHVHAFGSHAGGGLSSGVTLPETNGSPLKIGRNPIGKDRIPTIHFQGRKC